MKVFLTGATGYIGSVVAEYLLRTGHTVTGFVRSDAAAEKVQAAGVAPSKELRAAQGADAVIHLAAHWGPEMAQFDEETVRTLIGLLRGSGKTLVYTSGTWVIGTTRGHVAGEMAPLRPPAVVAWRPVGQRPAQCAQRCPEPLYARPSRLQCGVLGRIVCPPISCWFLASEILATVFLNFRLYNNFRHLPFYFPHISYR